MIKEIVNFTKNLSEEYGILEEIHLIFNYARIGG